MSSQTCLALEASKCNSKSIAVLPLSSSKWGISCWYCWIPCHDIGRCKWTNRTLYLDSLWTIVPMKPYGFSSGLWPMKGKPLSCHQYSRLDSSGQNLESNGVWSKNETGSRVESTSVTGSLVIRWNRKCKQYFEEGWQVVWCLEKRGYDTIQMW